MRSELRSIRPIRVNHLNLVVDDFQATVAFFQDVFDAEFLLDLPQPEWRACLVESGRVIFELFAPPSFLLFARYGPHFLGVEYQADMDQVRAAIASHGLRIARDIGPALHTHPADCFGVAFEFYAGSFHDNDWPALGGRKMQTAAHWRDSHPLGLSGLKGYTMAVDDIDAAEAFLVSFLCARRLHEESHPLLGARAVTLHVADGTVELLTPTGAGLIERHLRRYGDGIYSTVLSVRDLSQARDYLSARGVRLEPGSSGDSLAVTAGPTAGILIELAG